MVLLFILFVATVIFLFASDAVIDGITEVSRRIFRLIWKTENNTASSPSDGRERRRASTPTHLDGTASRQSPGFSEQNVQEQSAAQIREEQDNELQVSMLHDEVKVLEREEAQLNDKITRLEDDIDEQEKIAGMARHRISAFGSDNPKIIKALEDATTLLVKLKAEFDETSKSAKELNGTILDKRAILVCLQN